jgi:hypothetical protein
LSHRERRRGSDDLHTARGAAWTLPAIGHRLAGDGAGERVAVSPPWAPASRSEDRGAPKSTQGFAMQYRCL